MRFTFSSNPDETLRAIAAVTEIANRENRAHWVVGFALFPVLLTAGFIWPDRWIALAIILTVYAFLLWIGFMVEGRLRIKRRLVDDPATSLEWHVDVDEGGIRVQRGGLNALAAWSALHRVQETPEFYVFFTSPFAAQWIPRRVMGASESDLRTLVRAHSPDRGANLRAEGSARG
jgi:hypothetical protein